MDSKLRLPVTSKLVQTASLLPTLVFTVGRESEAFRQHGIEVLPAMSDQEGRPALRAVLGTLAQRGITRLLIEGGATVISAFLQAGIADWIEVFTAPASFGPRGAGEIAGLPLLLSGGAFTRIHDRWLGADLLESYAANT